MKNSFVNSNCLFESNIFCAAQSWSPENYVNSIFFTWYTFQVDKYEELTQTGKLDHYIKRKQKKNLGKERKKMHM